MLSTIPFTCNEPEIVAEPVNGKAEPPPPPDPVFTVIGNVEPSPLVNVIVFKATDAVEIELTELLAQLAVPAKLPVATKLSIVVGITILYVLLKLPLNK